VLGLHNINVSIVHYIAADCIVGLRFLRLRSDCCSAFVERSGTWRLAGKTMFNCHC
jgi:hypothetical protein